MEGKVMNINNPSMQDLKDGWISIKDRPLKLGEEVIGYNPSWIDEDFNPNGTRIGFLSDYGDNEVEGQINIENPDGGYQHFCQAKWCDYHDTYHTLYGEVGEDEPNMPTHYLLIPKHP